MPGRNSSSNSYRFGFQGQETDNEVNGDGNSVNYEYRIHDPRLGRFLSLDPLAAKYPHNSPYAFSENRVIDGIELEGLEFVKSTGEVVYDAPEYEGQIYLVDDDYAGPIMEGNEDFDSENFDVDDLLGHSTKVVEKNQWIGTDEQYLSFIKSQASYLGYVEGKDYTDVKLNSDLPQGFAIALSKTIIYEDGTRFMSFIDKPSLLAGIGFPTMGDLYSVRNSLEHEFFHQKQASALKKLYPNGITLSEEAFSYFNNKLEFDAHMFMLKTNNFTKSGILARNSADWATDYFQWRLNTENRKEFYPTLTISSYLMVDNITQEMKALIK